MWMWMQAASFCFRNRSDPALSDELQRVLEEAEQSAAIAAA